MLQPLQCMEAVSAIYVAAVRIVLKRFDRTVDV